MNCTSYKDIPAEPKNKVIDLEMLPPLYEKHLPSKFKGHLTLPLPDISIKPGKMLHMVNK